MQPLFIVIEGLDGSGKSTQIDMLRDALQVMGEACHLTAEPTDLPTGILIRRILRGEITVDPRTLAALFAADRVEHIHRPETGILDMLAAGYHVITSRYYFSSLAYQSEFVDPSWIAALNRQAKANLPADLTIFLDLAPEISLRRIADRGDDTELFETRKKLSHVRESFQWAFATFGEGENIVTLAADKNAVDLAEEILAEVNRLRK